MRSEILKVNCPKGVLILSLYIFAFSFVSLTLNGQTVLFGLLLNGTTFRIFNVVFCLIDVAIAFGLLFLKRWAFFAFLVVNFFWITMHLFDISTVTKDMLLSTGWQDVPYLVTGYRIIMTIAMSFNIGLICWLLFYRKYFNKA